MLQPAYAHTIRCNHNRSRYTRAYTVKPPCFPKVRSNIQQHRCSVFVPHSIESITIVKPAETIEGTLSRSKGLFAVGDRLVTSEDLGWSLRDAKTGDRVRLYGQPRTYVCPPDAQCLIGGSIPLFDIGRAERMR